MKIHKKKKNLTSYVKRAFLKCVIYNPIQLNIVYINVGKPVYKERVMLDIRFGFKKKDR